MSYEVILIRHFKVNFRWRLFYSSNGYRNACAEYDRANIIDGKARIESSDKVISSTMTRAIETSKLIFGRAPVFTDCSIVEVPINPFTTHHVVLPKFVWDVFGRIQWRLGSKHQPETYAQSISRVNLFVQRLVNSNENCVVVCHGWIIRLIIKSLKKQHGFAGPSPVLIKTGMAYSLKSSTYLGIRG